MNFFILFCFSIFHCFLYFLNSNVLNYFDNIMNINENGKNISFISEFIVDKFISKFVDVNSNIFYNLLIVDSPFLFLYLYIVFFGVITKFDKFDKSSVISILCVFLAFMFWFGNLNFAFTSLIINIITIPFYVFIYVYSKKSKELKDYKSIPKVNGKVIVDN